SPVARVYLQHVATDDSVRGAPLANGQRDGRDIAGGAKMGADSAALGAKLLQLMFGQEADHTSDDRLRIGVRIMHIAIPDSCAGDREPIVRGGHVGEAVVD